MSNTGLSAPRQRAYSNRVCCCFNFTQLFFACLTIYILCQIWLRHKQAFRCVFERASPCLVSFPSPESNKGPSIRGQAAVIASLQCRPVLVPGQAGGRVTQTVVLDTRPPHPPLPHQYSPSCVGHRSPCHVLLLLRLHSPCDRWKENERDNEGTGLVYKASGLNVVDRPRLWICVNFAYSSFWFCQVHHVFFKLPDTIEETVHSSVIHPLGCFFFNEGCYLNYLLLEMSSFHPSFVPVLWVLDVPPSVNH